MRLFFHITVCILAYLISSSIVSAQGTVNAGPDQTICTGSSNIQLNGVVTNSVNFYWEPNPTLSATNTLTPTATPTQTTTYTLVNIVKSENLIFNGDFEQGQTGYSSEHLPYLSEGGQKVLSDPSTEYFESCGDHTTGTSNMLAVNAACGSHNIPANAKVWCQTVSVIPNTVYDLSVWVTNIGLSTSLSVVQFSINGVDVGPSKTVNPTPCVWEQLAFTWNSGNLTTADICIYEKTGQCPANDYAIDDISFTYYKTITDNVTIYVSNMSTNISPSNATCGNINDGKATAVVTGGIPPYTYLWSNGQTSATATNLAAGNHTVIITDSKGCTSQKSVTITQPSNLTLNINPTLSTLTCFNDFTQISSTVSGGTAPYSYNWSSGENTPNISNARAGTYQLEITDLNLCKITQSVTITQPNLITSSFSKVECNASSYSLPSGKMVYNSGSYQDTIPSFKGCDSIITFDIKLSNIQADISTTNVTCFGLNNGEAFAEVHGGYAPYAYFWNNGQTTPTASHLNAGSYNLIVKDQENCEKTFTITISQPSPLIVSTSPPEAFCEGLSKTIQAQASGGTAPYSIVWNNNKTTWSQLVKPQNTTTFSAHVTDYNNCTASNGVTLTVFPQPVANFTISPSEQISEGETVVITNTSSLSDFNSWNLGDGNTAADKPTFSHIYDTEGEYCIELITTTVNGCVDNFISCIEILPAFSVYIPNAFTPNGDKINPTFRVIARSFSNMSMSVFNRWGEELIRLEGDQPLMLGWDGTYRGEPAPEGIYSYKIEVQDLKGQTHSYLGKVNLLR